MTKNEHFNTELMNSHLKWMLMLMDPQIIKKDYVILPSARSPGYKKFEVIKQFKGCVFQTSDGP